MDDRVAVASGSQFGNMTLEEKNAQLLQQLADFIHPPSMSTDEAQKSLLRLSKDDIQRKSEELTAVLRGMVGDQTSGSALKYSAAELKVMDEALDELISEQE